MSGRIVFWLLLLPMLCAGTAFAGEKPEHYLNFARSLFKEGDYYRAITEAKRFLFLKPDSPKRFDARLLIARSYREAGQYELARKAYLPLAAQKQRPDVAAAAILELGRSLEHLSSKDAMGYYRAVETEPRLPKGHKKDLQNRARYRLGWLNLDAGKWASAEAAFKNVDGDHKLKPAADALAAEAPKGADLPYKSPQTAGALSAVLPGAGQVYVGRGTDAALAFSLNTLFLWGTIDAYNSENWGVFTLLGLIEIGWYGGNIYNAVNGAHIHNREQRQKFLKKLRREHGWHVGYSPRMEGPMLTWSFRY